MAKTQSIFILLGALSVISLAGLSQANGGNQAGRFFVQGMVYCDTCRIQFMTRVSHTIDGATVRLECRNITAGTESFKAEAVTDKLGMYSIPIDGDYEDDICEVKLVKSPMPECSDIPNDMYSQQAAKVSITNNNGESTPVRNANALSFMRKDPLPECPEVLKELDMTDVVQL